MLYKNKKPIAKIAITKKHTTITYEMHVCYKKKLFFVIKKYIQGPPT